MSDKLEFLSASELGALVNEGQLSPVEVVKYFADHIAKNNRKTNAFVYLKVEEALDYARGLEKKIMNSADGYIGPFAGVPFGLKDFLPSKKGWSNTHGGVESLYAIDEYDSEFCKAMERAGGIALGKTNAPAFGFRGTTDNKLYGPTKNPFNPEYNSGGSSGGSAAAVGGQLIPIAEGGDAGGSIRIPAAWCNCYGFKASFGSIPNICRPDAWSASHPYCTPGGLTKTVKDAAILLSYMSKYDSRDPMSAFYDRPHYVVDIETPPKGLKIAFTVDYDLFEVDSEVADAVYAASLIFNEQSHLNNVVDEVDFNFKYTLDDMTDAWCTGICIDSAIQEINQERAGNPFKKEDLPIEFIKWNTKVRDVDIMDYYKFHLVRTDILDSIENIFEHYDIIISPTSSCLPVKNTLNTCGPSEINGKECDSLIGFAQTFLFNMTGHPAASVPVGFSKSGLPIGMQIIGKRYHESDVLRVSRLIEDCKPWRDVYRR